MDIKCLCSSSISSNSGGNISNMCCKYIISNSVYVFLTLDNSMFDRPKKVFICTE